MICVQRRPPVDDESERGGKEGDDENRGTHSSLFGASFLFLSPFSTAMSPDVSLVGDDWTCVLWLEGAGGAAWRACATGGTSPPPGWHRKKTRPPPHPTLSPPSSTASTKTRRSNRRWPSSGWRRTGASGEREGRCFASELRPTSVVASSRPYPHPNPQHPQNRGQAALPHPGRRPPPRRPAGG